MKACTACWITKTEPPKQPKAFPGSGWVVFHDEGYVLYNKEKLAVGNAIGDCHASFTLITSFLHYENSKHIVTKYLVTFQIPLLFK